MRRIRIIRNRLRSLLQRNRQEDELAREIEIHVSQLVKQLVADGMDAEAARLEAKRQFGSMDAAKEECRDMRRLTVIEDLFRDFRFALRVLGKSPGFTLTAVVSLVLGIGANVAMFQLFDAVRLRSLPVERPEELVSVRIRGEGRSGNFRGRNSQFTFAIWNELRQRQASFASVFAYGDTPVNLSPAGELRNVDGLWVSGSFFSGLGVKPQLGRLLTPDDDRPGCGWPGVVISHGFWQREFGGDPGVLSRTLPIEGKSVPILGVTTPEFFGMEVGRRFDIAMPICSAAAPDLGNRMFWFLAVMARVRPDSSGAAARSQIQALAPAIFEATVPAYQPQDQAKFKQLQLELEPASGGQSAFRESYTRPLTYLQWMVGLVLLLACVNLANMMLARTTAREHEFAVRRSLGASRWRLIRQVLLESFLLSSAGAAAGAVAAPLIGKTILGMIGTARDPVFLELGAGWRVLAFAISVTVVATLMFGLAPALQAGRANSRGSSDNLERLNLRRGLLLAQVALCMLLLTTALLVSRSFQNLLDTNPGFDARGLLVASVFLDDARYSPERRPAIIQELDERIRAIPGVSAVARSYVIPISGSGWDRGARVSPVDQPRGVNLNSVSAGYFDAMKLPLLAGRDFGAKDGPTAPPVAIVNQTFARTFFAGQNPVGKTFRLDGPEPPFEIIGLTGDSKYRTLAEELSPIVYFHAGQERVPRTTVRFVIRGAVSPESLMNSARRVVLEADPQLNLRSVILQTQLRESVLRERLMAKLTGAFGLLGAMLALTGIFGVTAYIVSRRHREFGVRMALGATGSGIVRLVLAEIALVLLSGIVIGSGLALTAAMLMSSVLYGIKPYDPTALAGVGLALSAGGLFAAFIPALRASRVAPVEALRAE